MKKLPLEGIRIADLTAVWAGPYATRLLADMGAEVIKVEAPKSPDLLRTLHLLPPDTPNAYNRSAYFNHNNRNKKSVILDLANEAGRDVFLQLVATCDVVIENYRAEVLDKLRLGYDVLREVKEDIILVSMPGHGKTGPEKDFVAFGTNVEQLAGLASLSGYVDGPPQKTGISYGDPVAGVAAAGAVMTALIARRRTGKGQYVELAQREALTTLIGEQVLAYQVTGKQPERIGNRHPFMAPHGCYPAAGEDKWLVVACRNDADFALLCEVIGEPQLAEDDRFREVSARHANQAELDTRISDWTRDQDRETAVSRLVAAGIPAASVLNHVDLYHDQHLRERGFFERVHHEDAGDWDMEGPVFHFKDRPASIRANAPRFGEHNHEVFTELLGLSEEQVQDLETRGITATTPDLSAHR